MSKLDRYTVTKPERLDKALKEHNLPGQRSKTAIIKLRRERQKRKMKQELVPLKKRFERHVVERYGAEIERRGGETSIPTGPKNQRTHLHIADRKDGLTLLRVAGWRWYSWRYGVAYQARSYLCGREDGQLWAVRVPGTITTVSKALDWITPAAVKDAMSRGKIVVRQGDVYAIQTNRRWDGVGASDLPDNHTWDPETRTLRHPEHGTLHLPHHVRFILQRALPMEGGSDRVAGD